MKFSEIVETAIGREARKLRKQIGKRAEELSKQAQTYSKEINKLKNKQLQLRKQLSYSRGKKAARLTGEIAGLMSSIEELEDKKNKTLATLKKYKARIAPEIETPEIEPVTKTPEAPVVTKSDLEQFFDKMKKEIVGDLKSYVDSKLQTKEPGEIKKEVEKKAEKEIEKAKEEVPEIPSKVITPKPTKKTKAYREVKNAFISGPNAPFKAGPLKKEVESALEQAFKENPEADYDELIARIDELVPEFNVE